MGQRVETTSVSTIDQYCYYILDCYRFQGKMSSLLFLGK